MPLTSVLVLVNKVTISGFAPHVIVVHLYEANTMQSRAVFTDRP
jgi:hypothetical protein